MDINILLFRYIPVDKFAQILSAVKLRRIPDYVRQHIVNVADLNKGTANEGSVSYAQFVACNDIFTIYIYVFFYIYCFSFLW